MNRNDLYESMDGIHEDVLERSEKNKHRKRKIASRWVAAVAAVLVVALVGGILHGTVGSPLVPTAYAIAEAEYPQMAPYPDENSPSFSEEFDAWTESINAQQQEPGYADGLSPFFTQSMGQFLSGGAGENRAYSPLNVYMALGMLAELTDGNSRQQILDLLGADSVEALRTQAKAVWNAHYCDDGATTSILASSVWLNEDVSFNPSAMESLAKNYYASSYQGTMGSDDFNQIFHDWLNTQTGGLLKEQAQELNLDGDTVMALATTIYFRAKWADEFRESTTASDTFHGVNGNVTCDFMHKSANTSYYWGNRFGAVGKPMENGSTMWLLLPDEEVTVEELVNDSEAMEFLLSNGVWDNSKYMTVNLSLPKFDVVSQMNLQEGLREMGVTDVFDGSVSDFSPMTTDVEGIYVSRAQHDVRVAIDEEGVTAAAYTVMQMEGAGAPPDEEIDFTLDRPFIFVITSGDGLPLFAGVVHQPG